MKYILLLLLFPLCAVSEEESPLEESSRIDRTPVYFYRGGPYYSRGVLCRDPYPHIRQFGHCPYYHYWEYNIDFKTTRPENHRLRENTSNLHFESLRGDAYAQSFLASYYERGLGVPQDLSKAYAWFKISSENGNKTAQYKLDKLIERAPEIIEEGENQVVILSEKIDSFGKEEEEEPSTLNEQIEDTMLFSQKNALPH